MLKSDAEPAELKPSDHVLPYSDPVLRRKVEMEGLVRKLAATGFLTFRRAARSNVGVFCVAKKDHQLRLIFDCRATNVLCKLPPTTELATPNAFADLDLRDGDPTGVFVGRRMSRGLNRPWLLAPPMDLSRRPHGAE